jgi:arginase family enzyme
MMENYFINVPFDESDAKHTIYNNFNYEVKSLLYSSFDENDIPIIYNFIYKYIKSLDDKKRPVLFSPDYSISSATFPAMAEKFLECDEEHGKKTYKSSIKIIYMTPICHFKQLTHLSAMDFSKSILSNVFDDNEISFTKHEFIVPPDQIYLVGLNDTLIDSDDIEKMSLHNMKYFTLSTIRKKGIESICKYIMNQINDDPVYFIYDLSVLSFETAPCVFRMLGTKEKKITDIDGLKNEEIIKIFNIFKSLNIIGLDITGYNLKKNTPDIPFKITSQCAKNALIYLLGIKEKKINVFNENTKIVICKPIDNIENWENKSYFSDNTIRKNAIDKIKDALEEEDIQYNSDDEEEYEENDIGWYIMRGLSTELKEEIIQKLLENDDNIIMYNTGTEHLYISFTTLEDQEKISYYTANSIKDRALTPAEKVNLIFSQL